MKIKVLLEDTVIEAEVDTGASATLINERTYECLNTSKHVKCSYKILRMYTRNVVPVVETLNANLELSVSIAQ